MRDIITKLEQLNEGHMSDMAHEVEKDHEVQMARSDLYKAAKYAVSIHKMMKDVSEMEGIDGWVAAKITKAADYLGSVKHYMEGQAMSDVELAVVPVAGDMTDAMTLPQESLEEGRLGFKDIAKFGSAIASKIDMEARRRGSADMEPGDADELRYRIAKEMGLVEGVEVVEAEERTYIVVHAKHGKEEIKASSSYGAAKKYAEMKKLKSTAGVDAYLADEEKTATESVEEVAEGRMSMRQLASMDRDAVRKIEAMVGDESRYADMGDYQEALYNAARRLGLVESVISEDRELMVRATNIDYDGPALDKLPTDVNVKVMVNPGDSEDEIFDMVADELEDRYGVKVSGFDMAMMEALTKAQQDAIDAAPGRTIDDMKPAERASLKKFVKNTPQNTSKPAQDFYKKMGYNKLANEEQVAEEDVIGNIIGKLAQGKAGSRGGKDIIGDIIAKLPKDDKKDAEPTVPMQTKQKMANKMALPKSKPDRSMGQDTTKIPAAGMAHSIATAKANQKAMQTNSKFSEWSKK